MDLKEQQIGSAEQRIVLCTLAKSVAYPGCKFIEVGSWCGDSTVILGKVVKQCGGILYCIDWWKGNDGTYLEEIARKEDVFTYFWEKIKREGLEDVVVPIRGKSETISEILKENTFDFVFIDADHRYDSVLQDIHKYAPLVKQNKGILCGHDCEGFVSDFDLDFLKAGRNVDEYESIHCGVVLAVGYIFKDYSINHSIWSVKATGRKKQWEATNLTFEGIKDQRRAIPSPIASTKNYILFRYGNFVYAVPNTLGSFDIREEHLRNDSRVISAYTLSELRKAIGESLSFTPLPVLVGSYRGFNMVEYKNKIYAIDQGLGQIDIVNEDEEKMEKYRKDRTCFITTSIDEARLLIAELHLAMMKAEAEKRDNDILALKAKVAKIRSTQ